MNISEFKTDSTFKPPAVSWLLCSHVVNDHLKLAIDSCLAQTFSDFEVIFVANGHYASDVANKVCEWYIHDPRVRIFVTHMQQLSFSLSLGLHQARAALIARMDSDDISCPKRLERQVAFMAVHDEVAVLGTAYEIIDNTGHVMKKISMPESNQAIRRGLLRGNPLCHPSVMFRRQVILDAGGYLGGLHAEDYDLWSRLSLSTKIQFANLPNFCLKYRVIGVGMARGSRWAYASIAASQLRNFLVGGGLLWFFASLISVGKLMLRSYPIHDLK